MQNQTVPTGLSGVPPSGPAIPLTAMATSAPDAPSAPRAISLTVRSLTAPKRASVRADTPSTRRFASFEYVMYPLSSQSELPAVSVRAFAIHPAVHDSAVTTRNRACSSRCPTLAANRASARSFTTLQAAAQIPSPRPVRQRRNSEARNP